MIHVICKIFFIPRCVLLLLDDFCILFADHPENWSILSYSAIKITCHWLEAWIKENMRFRIPFGLHKLYAYLRLFYFYLMEWYFFNMPFVLLVGNTKRLYMLLSVRTTTECKSGDNIWKPIWGTGVYIKPVPLVPHDSCWKVSVWK